jgi:hypothetical protein
VPRIKALLEERVAEDAAGLIYLWEPERVTVEFANGRRQAIDYGIENEFYIFTSRIATRVVVERVGREKIAKEILLRNRVSHVVAFQLTKSGIVEGRIEQRAATLQAEELRFYL